MTSRLQFLVQLVRSLWPAMYMPGDFIVRVGEVGHEMYFLVSGEVEVIDPKDR